MGEVPRTFTGWIEPPRVTDRPWRGGTGRSRKVPRLVAGSPPARDVQYLLEHAPALRDQPWVRYYVKDGEKGPIVWEAKHTRITVKDEHGLPGMGLHLVVARNVLNAEEVKFFVSNASPETPVDVLLVVGFSRWQVERCFEDQKQEVGLDQWEGRTWRSLKRHLILSAISYLFLARVRQGLRGEKSGADRLPGALGRQRPDSQLVAQQARWQKIDRANRPANPIHPATQHRDAQEPLPTHTSKTTGDWHQHQKSDPLQMALTMRCSIR